MRLLPLVAAAALLAAGCAGPVDATDATVTVYAGKVWTADDTMPWAEAFAVVGDRFGAVGDLRSVQAAHPGARVVHVEGLLLPGFHDTHNHLVRTMLSPQAEAGDPFEPWPPGWDPVAGTVGQQQIAAGHIQEWLMINADRVQGGSVPKPPGRALPVGEHAHVHERDAMTDVGTWQGIAVSPPNLALAQEALARYGITSTVEAGAPLASLQVLQDLEAQGALTARYNLYIFPEDLDATLAAGLVTGNGTGHARLLGMKIYSDGWLGPRTAAVRELYNDRPHTGFSFYTQDELDDWVLRAHQGGLKVTAHTIGDRAVSDLLTAYERATSQGCTGHVVCDDPRFTLEHVQITEPDILQRMVDLALVPSIQMSFATTDSHYAASALGARVQDSYAWRTMLDLGLRIGGSSDWPIEVLPPLWGIERMVTRQEVDGSLAAPWMPEQAVSLEEALRMVTIDAAYLEHRDHELGSITPGKLADFVVLAGDLFTMGPAAIAETPVVGTVVGGRTVHGHVGPP